MGARGWTLVVATVAATACACMSVVMASTTTKPYAHEVELEASVGGGPWTKRSMVRYAVDLAEKKITVKFAEAEYTLPPPSQWGDGTYRVRMPSVDAQGKLHPERPLQAVTRLCDLASEGKEKLHLHADKTGAVTALHFEWPTVSRECAAPPSSSSSAGAKVVNRILVVVQREAAVVPVVRIPLATGPNAEQPGQDPAQQQSFLQKNWHILLPVAIYTLFIQPMLQGREDAPSGGAAGGGGGGARRGGAAAGGGARAAAAAS